MASTTNGHSAKVALTLLVDGLELPVSHVGNSGLMVRSTFEPLPAGDATLLVEIDGRLTEHAIFLPDGLPGPNRFVKFF